VQAAELRLKKVDGMNTSSAPERAFTCPRTRSVLVRALGPIAAAFCLLPSLGSMAAEDRVLFNRDIRPILAENCFPCHGPDSAARKAGLRLDRREVAVKIGAIVPGKTDESELVSRVFSGDPAERMPPPASHKQLTAAQKDLLRRWIAAGAEYQPHWALIAPVRPQPPPVTNPAWGRNPIDAFVLSALQQRGLQPAPEADRRTLARRLSLDLTGLPPAPAEVEAFVKDPSPAAYENLVDRLLASPRWGEHRGRYWLDAARYADTHGIHFDNYREMWSYRDWVIEAFNRDLPFDRFTIEQLAGDLLPDATPEQRVASGFNRCNITTNEGGAIAEEYLVLYARDRTETTARVWLGLTAGCAVCHDHKFDPLTQKEFYQMSAFFNNTTQGAMDGNVKDTPPVLFLPAPADRRRWPALAKELADAKRQVEERKKKPGGDLDKSYQELTARVAALEKEEAAAKARGTAAHVMQERNEPARAFLLYRGEYDKRREPLTAETPALLPPMPADLPKDRLGFARWLLRPEQPLTARVAVNRFWQEVFGAGLVRTAEDFGVNGELPSHPELLDWLAVEFRESGWDVKKLFRLLVTSAAYRQAAVATPEKLEKDPQNRLLSRGPRFRMDAEMVRDYALAAGGLLVAKIGGPSVKPYQPDGVWEAVAMMESNTRNYQRDHGESLYRRSMYTFWKRAAPPASMDIFNAPSRETCTVRRERTNTPLQALVTLNDPQFVEAARHLAESALREGGATAESRLDFAARRLLARSFRPEESTSVLATLGKLLDHYRAHPEQAKDLLAVGEAKVDPAPDAATLAAWTMLMNQLLNLDEVLNK
jgi:hypothetical protein